MRLGYLLALCGAVSAHLMESLPEVPEGWQEIGRPLPEERLLLRIAMNSPNEGLFEQTLMDISTPGSRRYGKHLKRDELKYMLKPTSEATASVTNWLLQSGVNHEAIADDGEWINFVVTTELAEKLLDTTFAIFKNSNGDRKVRTLHYSVPSAVHGFIDMIQPTTRFGDTRPQRSAIMDVTALGQAPFYGQDTKPGQAGPGTPANANAAAGPPGGGAPGTGTLGPFAGDNGCIGEVTPACIRALYNIPDNPRIDNGSCGFMAFTNFLEQYPRRRDLLEFQREYFPQGFGTGFTQTDINGGVHDENSPEDSTEGNLDVQYMMISGFPINLHSYSTAGRGPHIPDISQPNVTDNEPYLEYLQYMLALPDHELPHTLATSYGENEQSVPEQYRRTVCNMFGQLGARGVSIIFASGDTGVGSGCVTNDGRNKVKFLPMFPASCPYVTAVGATTGSNPETAIAESSGGFSDSFKRPAYQDQVIRDYLGRIGHTNAGLFTRGGRAMPDVAAQGKNFHVIDKGEDKLISGTSAAAPVVGGIVALLNAQRIQAGMPPLGFLNPWIYSSGWRGFNDITAGQSGGCDDTDYFSGLPEAIIPGAAWHAIPGWDAVTGFGSPDYEKLLPLAIDVNGTS